MSYIDWSWVFIFAVFGLFSFFLPKKISGLKGFASIFSIILLILTFLEGSLSDVVILSHVITSLVSTSTYLIGANISRFLVMKEPPSPKIIAYFLIIFVLSGPFG